jgi:hypothetical protein
MMKTQMSARRKVVRSLGFAGVPLALMLAQPLPLSARTTASGIDTGSSREGARFMSGGVGLEERQRMLEMAPGYDLKLSFADRLGHYLSDVNVTVSDEHGKQVLITTTKGPWLYIKLPQGKYDVKASYADRTEEIKNLEITNGQLLTRLLHWNSDTPQISQR